MMEHLLFSHRTPPIVFILRWPIVLGNSALLSKWIWRFYTEDKPLWKLFISAKYKAKVMGDIPNQCRYSSKRAPWWDISKYMSLLHSNMKWKVHNGHQVRFLLDHWTMTGPLKDLYPRFFVLCEKQLMAVGEAYNDNTDSWSLFPRRSLLEMEIHRWAEITSSWEIPHSIEKDLYYGQLKLMIWNYLPSRYHQSNMTVTELDSLLFEFFASRMAIKNKSC